MSVLSTLAVLEYYQELAHSLPPPVMEQPEHRERRLATAIEAFQALKPGDAYEGRLAVQIVLCGAHAVECQREAGVYRDDFAKRTRCRAQANSMLREERAAKRILGQEQKLRLALETVTGTEWARPSMAAAPPPSADIRTAALRPHVEAAEAAPQPGPERPVVVPVRAAADLAGSQTVAGVSAPPPSAEAMEQAEAFMAEEMVAAAQIRHDRGLTPRCRACFHAVTFPTDPAVIDALVRGMSDNLVVLDEIGGEDLEGLDEAA